MPDIPNTIPAALAQLYLHEEGLELEEKHNNDRIVVAFIKTCIDGLMRYVAVAVEKSSVKGDIDNLQIEYVEQTLSEVKKTAAEYRWLIFLCDNAPPAPYEEHADPLRQLRC